MKDHKRRQNPTKDALHYILAKQDREGFEVRFVDKDIGEWERCYISVETSVYTHFMSSTGWQGKMLNTGRKYTSCTQKCCLNRQAGINEAIVLKILWKQKFLLSTSF